MYADGAAGWWDFGGLVGGARGALLGGGCAGFVGGIHGAFLGGGPVGFVGGTHGTFRGLPVVLDVADLPLLKSRNSASFVAPAGAAFEGDFSGTLHSDSPALSSS